MKNPFLLKRVVFVAAVSFALGTAWAQDPSGGVSTQTAESMLGESSLDVRPQVGFLNYTDSTQTGYSTLAVGATASYNALKSYNPFDWDSNLLSVGPQTGLIFSHLSVSGANFFYIPVNLQVGYLATDRLRLGVHGGTNLTYRSTENAMRLTDGIQGVSSVFKFLPNVGVDIDYAINPSVALSFRPDLTFSSGNNILSATLAAVIPLA